MSKNEVKVNVTFNYGGWTLRFCKIFYLSFIPFYDLVIMDGENTISLVTNDYCRTTIYFHTDDDSFEVSIDNFWHKPVSNESIDEEIEIFLVSDWEREDTTDIVKLKELMNREYERSKK